MIKLFVGCAANNEDIESQIVLEHSFRERCSRDIQITWMMLSNDPSSKFYGWNTERWSTPFSGLRWAVPELCNFQGRALYVDSDVIAMADVAELWNTPIEIGKALVAKGGRHNWRFCVTLWDCSVARSFIPPIDKLKRNPIGHAEMIAYFKSSQLVQSFSGGNWNCIDGEDYKDINDPDIKILHYSSEAHQPQLRHAIPRLVDKEYQHWFDGQVKRHWRPEIENLFDKELMQAYIDGYKIEDYIKEPYGEYVKASMKNYRSHQWAR